MSLLDEHEHRHRLKLLKDAGDHVLYENRDGVVCPVCERVFHRALLTEASGRSFGGVDGGICVGRDETRLYVFTHP